MVGDVVGVVAVMLVLVGVDVVQNAAVELAQAEPEGTALVGWLLVQLELLCHEAIAACGIHHPVGIQLPALRLVAQGQAMAGVLTFMQVHRSHVSLYQLHLLPGDDGTQVFVETEPVKVVGWHADNPGGLVDHVVAAFRVVA
ncbi:hypothetical protein D3C80_1387240 [compost metagenome]